MSGFLYYLNEPKSAIVVDHRGQQQLAEGELRAVRLLDTLSDALEVPKQCVACEVKHGPDGKPGTILYPVPIHGGLPARLGYDRERQRWESVELRGVRQTPVYWIGWYQDEPPRPADLERRERIRGWEIQDAYGDAWSIPVARSPHNPRGSFPYAVEYGPDYQPRCGVSGKYRRFWEESARLWDLVAAHAQPSQGGLAVLGEGLSAEDDAFALQIVHLALQVNYRVDLPTLAAYNLVRPGWLTQVTLSLMANAIVDMHARREWEAAQKKTVTPSEPAGWTSTAGEPDATPITNPVEAS